MPAPFALELSGYRVDKKTGVATDLPNASDSNDDLSVRLGVEMLREMGIAAGTPGPTDPGTLLETLTIQHLKGLRPDLEVHRAKAARAFLQYGHLGVTADFVSLLAKSAAERPALLDRIEASDAEWPPANRTALADRRRALKRLRSLLQKEAQAFEDFRDQVSHEDLLRIDITLATDIGGQWPELRMALSAKWTLRTDRAQDCVSQGAKLASQKRGRMPHYAVITAEPRPAMLKIPSDGPSVDCVYHIDLPALDRALTRMAGGNPRWSPKVTFDRLVRQGRLRDYDDLVHQALEVPRSMEEALPVTERVPEEG